MFTTPENTKDFLYRIRDKEQGDFKTPKQPKPPKYTAITIKRPGRIIKDNIKSVLSKKYGEKYKPFKTVVEIDHQISGKIKGYKK